MYSRLHSVCMVGKVADDVMYKVLLCQCYFLFSGFHPYLNVFSFEHFLLVYPSSDEVLPVKRNHY